MLPSREIPHGIWVQPEGAPHAYIACSTMCYLARSRPAFASMTLPTWTRQSGAYSSGSLLHLEFRSKT